MAPEHLPILFRRRSYGVCVGKVHFALFLFQLPPFLTVLGHNHAELARVVDDGLVGFVIEVSNVGGSAEEKFAGSHHEGVEALIVVVFLSDGQERIGSRR